MISLAAIVHLHRSDRLRVTCYTTPAGGPNVNALEFGWYLPTNGDTTAFNVPEKQMPPSPDLFERIIHAAEGAGFEYLLLPVIPACWEAYMSGAFLAARTRSIKPLLAARPGYINPVLLAKMLTTFDQLTGGRLCINLIAGVSDRELQAEGISYSKEDRYALMDEEVTIMKALWTADGPIDFRGRFHTLNGAEISPPPLSTAPSTTLSRRGLGRRLGSIGQALRRASVLGGHTGTHRLEYRGTAPAGRSSWPWRHDCLRHAFANHLPRG